MEGGREVRRKERGGSEGRREVRRKERGGIEGVKEEGRKGGREGETK